MNLGDGTPSLTGKEEKLTATKSGESKENR